MEGAGCMGGCRGTRAGSKEVAGARERVTRRFRVHESGLWRRMQGHEFAGENRGWGLILGESQTLKPLGGK